MTLRDTKLIENYQTECARAIIEVLNRHGMQKNRNINHRLRVSACLSALLFQGQLRNLFSEFPSADLGTSIPVGAKADYLN